MLFDGKILFDKELDFEGNIALWWNFGLMTKCKENNRKMVSQFDN